MPLVFIDIFIQAINISLRREPNNKLIDLINQNKINWFDLLYKAKFHGLRPILYDVFSKIETPIIPCEIIHSLKKYSTQQYLLNVKSSQELKKIFDILSFHGIDVIPFKGVVFVHELYPKKVLRENSDLDILVRKCDATFALKKLVQEGYHFILPENYLATYSIDELIDQLVFSNGFQEVGLKSAASDIHIDFHWSIFEDNYQYKLPVEYLFSNLKPTYLFNFNCNVPNLETLFWTLVIHHGGREKWTRLKYFSDLIAFVTLHFDSVDWQVIIRQADMFKMKRIVFISFYILETKFNLKIPNTIKSQYDQINFYETKYIYIYWSLSRKSNSSLYLKLISYFLYFSLQDSGYSYFRHIKYSFLKRSLPSLLEPESRIFVLPKQYTFANFFGKLVTNLLIYLGLRSR